MMATCVNKDISIGGIPHVNQGRNATAVHATSHVTWMTQPCRFCGEDVWVMLAAVHKFGRDCWTCKPCKKAKRLECLQAAVAVEKRRAEITKRMGMRRQ